MTRFFSAFTLSSCCSLTALALAQGCTAAGAPAGAAARVASSGAAEAAAAARSTQLSTELAALLPRGLTTMGVTRLGGSLYVIGGYFGQPHNYSKEFQSADFERLDLASGTWEQLPGATALQSVVLVNDGHYLYRVGGMRALNAAGEKENLQSVTEVARFDPDAKTWTALPSLPTPRSSHQAVIAGHTLYVVGGWALAGGEYDSTWADALLSCDLSAPSCEWKSTPVPFKTRAMGAAVYHGKLYVTGGLTPEESSSDVWVGDLATGAWVKGPALADENLTPTAGVWADQLFANGGDGNLYRLSSDGQKWETAGALQFPRMFHQLVAGDDGLWVVGGVPGGKDRGARIRHVEHVGGNVEHVQGQVEHVQGKVEHVQGKAEHVASAGVVWTLEAQSTAKNRQGVFLQGQQLYVFGGNNSLEQHDFAANNFVDSAFRLDLGSLDWKPLEKLPVARQSMQSVVAGDAEPRTAYAVGGFGFANEHLATQADVFSYDLESAKWSQLSHGLPAPRSQFGLAVWSNSLWVIGGLDYDDSRKEKEQFQHPTAVLRMDLREPMQGFSLAGLALREQRRAFAGAQLGARYYLTGGIHADFQAVSNCEVLDLEHKQSLDMACPSQQRLGGELVPLRGKLYLVGGSVEVGGSREPSSRIEVYDPGTDRWSTLSEKLPLETPAQLRAFAFHDDLLLYSAQQKTAHVQLALIHVDALASGASNYASLQVTPTPEAPVSAKTAAVSHK